MQKLIQTVLAAAAVLSTLGFTSLLALEPAQPKVVALMFYSDTCGSCKILDPKIEAVKGDYAAKPILFATLDHSNDGTKNQAALLAESLGLGKVYASQEKASGYMLLLNAESGEIIAKIDRDMGEADIKTAFDEALQG